MQRCLSVAADVTPVHQSNTQKFPTARKKSCVGRDAGPNAMLQRSLQCSGPATSPTAQSMIPLDWHWWSLRDGLASLLANLWDFPRRCPNRRLHVAPGRDFVVPKLVDEPRCSPCNPKKFRSFLGTSNAHVILSLRSRMTSTAVTCSSDSISPRNL